MKIAVISDTHSRYEAVEKAVALIDEAKVELTLHCGDIDDSETIWLFQPNTHFVWGNCDYDKTSMRQAIHGIGATCHEYMGNLELAGCKIAWVHGDNSELLADLEHSGHFDFLFHGHTHVANERQTGDTRIINPGALHRVATKTFIVLNLDTGELESIVVS